MIYQTVNFSAFIDEFLKMDRYHNFNAYADEGAYQALRVIFDYLEEVHDEDVELDVIAICCDFAHDTASEIADMYGLGLDEHETGIDADEDKVRQYLEDQGVLVGETLLADGRTGFVYFQH